MNLPPSEPGSLVVWVGQSAGTACSSYIPLAKAPSELSFVKFQLCAREGPSCPETTDPPGLLALS